MNLVLFAETVPMLYFEVGTLFLHRYAMSDCGVGCACSPSWQARLAGHQRPRPGWLHCADGVFLWTRVTAKLSAVALRHALHYGLTFGRCADAFVASYAAVRALIRVMTRIVSR